VGHRVVHGGERFVRSVAIDDEVLRGIEETIELAPLHNPANLRGIAAVRAVLGPGVPQVAVFDTAFHHTLPERAYLYAIPYSLYRRHRVRRYGFHGTSHRYVATAGGSSPAPPARRSASSPCTWATAARRAPSSGASRWTPRWASRRWRGW
jgi:acetate kinase